MVKDPRLRKYDQNEKVKMMLKLMEWDYLTEVQLDLVLSFGEQFGARGHLTTKQFDVLESIFNQAAERA